MKLRTKVRELIHETTGFDISRDVRPDAFRDMGRLVGNNGTPVIFDVGANVGQTTSDFLELFPTSTIHAFEPGESAFRQLHQSHAHRPNVHLNNFGLASMSGQRQFNENSASVMSSFLPLGPDGWGEIVASSDVMVSTVDTYCAEHSIASIDLLKSDTQGLDLEVLKGSETMLQQGHIYLIYLEVTFTRMYMNAPRFDSMYGFLADHAFDLVGLYNIHYREGRIGWADALFIYSKGN